MQLLLASLQRTAMQQPPEGEGEVRRGAVGGTLVGIMEHMPGPGGSTGPSLPLQSDPDFWVSHPTAAPPCNLSAGS